MSGRLVVQPGVDDAHVITGETLPELAGSISERLAHCANVTGGLTLNADFGRGKRAVQQLFNGDVHEEPGRSNPTMWPLSDSGPYYAALVTGGTLDTKGGPKTSVKHTFHQGVTA